MATFVVKDYNSTQYGEPLAKGREGLSYDGKITREYIAGEAIPFGTFVAVKDDGKLYKLTSTNTNYIGIALWNNSATGTDRKSYATDDTVNLLVFGYVIVETVSDTNKVTKLTDTVNAIVASTDQGKITKQAVAADNRVSAKAKVVRVYDDNLVNIFVNATT